MEKSILIHPEELTDAMVLLLQKAGINRLGLHPVGGAAAAQTAEAFSALSQTPSFRRKLSRLRESDIAVEYELHALSYLLPRKLFTTHADWFRSDETGNRTPNGNLCPGNPEALQVLASRAAEFVRLMPSDTGRYYLWPDDAQVLRCHCDKCRELSAADQALLMDNAILQGIRSVYPDAKASYLAYESIPAPGSALCGTMLPPTVVRPEPGIFLEYAPMRRNTAEPFETGSGNALFRNQIAPLLNFFGPKDAQVLEYWMDNSMFSNWKKPPAKLEISLETIRRDIAFYRRMGFEHITSFGCFLSDDYTALYGEPPIAAYAGLYDENGI